MEDIKEKAVQDELNKSDEESDEIVNENFCVDDESISEDVKNSLPRDIIR